MSTFGERYLRALLESSNRPVRSHLGHGGEIDYIATYDCLNAKSYTQMGLSDSSGPTPDIGGSMDEPEPSQLGYHLSFTLWPKEKSNSSNVFLKGNDAVFILISNDRRFPPLSLLSKEPLRSRGMSVPWPKTAHIGMRAAAVILAY